MAGVNARVVLVEDHPVVVDGLTASFRGRPGVEVVGRAGTLAEARELLHTVACDVVLLDLRLPDGSGIQLLREWREAPSAPAFLVLSSFLTPEYVSAAVALGASGFLLKTSPASEILAAVAAVADGGLAFTPEQLRVSQNASWSPLTAREHEVLDGVVRGRSNDEIAGDLGVSRKAVEAHLTRLLARYGVASRTELAVHADRHQLLELPTRRRQGA